MTAVMHTFGLRQTTKLYYQQPWLSQATARIVRVHGAAVELDQTVAYPEGGGQESDTGLLCTPVGPLRVVAVSKRYGTPITLEGFKGGTLGGIILHEVAAEHLPLLARLQEGMAVQLAIDIPRRAGLTLAHSASHFLYAAVLALRPELQRWTLGCHIKEGGARFDFLVDEPFSSEDIAAIEQQANAWIAENGEIHSDAVAGLEDARLWRYGAIEIPCGGTHLDRAGAIGPLKVRRKRLGQGKERLACEFPQALLPLARYHG